MWYIWLIAAGIFFIFEMATIGFLIFWLGIGALIAMIVSFFTSNLILQTIVFIISSTALILFTKPLINKFIDTKDSVKTNYDLIINKHGIVTVEIDPLESKGQIKVLGQLWSATTEGEIKIPINTKIEVVEVSGVKAIVRPI